MKKFCQSPLGRLVIIFGFAIGAVGIIAASRVNSKFKMHAGGGFSSGGGTRVDLIQVGSVTVPGSDNDQIVTATVANTKTTDPVFVSVVPTAENPFAWGKISAANTLQITVYKATETSPTLATVVNYLVIGK